MDYTGHFALFHFLPYLSNWPPLTNCDLCTFQPASPRDLWQCHALEYLQWTSCFLSWDVQGLQISTHALTILGQTSKFRRAKSAETSLTHWRMKPADWCLLPFMIWTGVPWEVFHPAQQRVPWDLVQACSIWISITGLFFPLCPFSWHSWNLITK